MCLLKSKLSREKRITGSWLQDQEALTNHHSLLEIHHWLRGPSPPPNPEILAGGCRWQTFPSPSFPPPRLSFLFSFFGARNGPQGLGPANIFSKCQRVSAFDCQSYCNHLALLSASEQLFKSNFRNVTSVIKNLTNRPPAFSPWFADPCIDHHKLLRPLWVWKPSFGVRSSFEYKWYIFQREKNKLPYLHIITFSSNLLYLYINVTHLFPEKWIPPKGLVRVSVLEIKQIHWLMIEFVFTLKFLLTRGEFPAPGVHAHLLCSKQKLWGPWVLNGSGVSSPNVIEILWFTWEEPGCLGWAHSDLRALGIASLCLLYSLMLWALSHYWNLHLARVGPGFVSFQSHPSLRMNIGCTSNLAVNWLFSPGPVNANSITPAAKNKPYLTLGSKIPGKYIIWFDWVFVENVNGEFKCLPWRWKIDSFLWQDRWIEIDSTHQGL